MELSVSSNNFTLNNNTKFNNLQTADNNLILSDKDNNFKLKEISTPQLITNLNNINPNISKPTDNNFNLSNQVSTTSLTPLAHYKLNDLNFTNSITNISGYNVNATLVDGKIGSAISFNGINTNPMLSPIDDFSSGITIAFWNKNYKPSGLNTNYQAENYYAGTGSIVNGSIIFCQSGVALSGGLIMDMTIPNTDFGTQVVAGYGYQSGAGACGRYVLTRNNTGEVLSTASLGVVGIGSSDKRITSPFYFAGSGCDYNMKIYYNGNSDFYLDYVNHSKWGYEGYVNRANVNVIQNNGSYRLYINGSGFSNGPGVCSGGRWQHIVVTHDNTRNRMYTDGLLRSTGSYYTPITSNAGSFWLGSSNVLSNWSTPWCEMDDLRIYNRALNQNEINSIYKSGLGTERDDLGISSLILKNNIETGSLTPSMHYTFNTSGASITDNFGQVGSIVNNANGVFYVGGVIDKAVQLSGLSYFNAYSPTWANVGTGSPFSLALWYCWASGFSGTSTNYGIVCKGQYQSARWGMHMTSGTNPIVSWGFRSGNYNSEVGIGSTGLNQWHHWVGTYNGSNYLYGYKNGSLTSSFNTNGSANNILTGSINIGGNNIRGGNLGAQVISNYDDIRFYNQQLNINQIKKIYNYGAGTEREDIEIKPVTLNGNENFIISSSLNNITIKEEKI